MIQRHEGMTIYYEGQITSMHAADFRLRDTLGDETLLKSPYVVRNIHILGH